MYVPKFLLTAIPGLVQVLCETLSPKLGLAGTKNSTQRIHLRSLVPEHTVYIAIARAFRTRPFRRTQTEVRNSDSDSDLGSDLSDSYTLTQNNQSMKYL
jgi:hypothetical protein